MSCRVMVTFGIWAFIAPPVVAQEVALPADIRATIPQSGRLVFDVTRNGTPLGTHAVTFAVNNGFVEATIDIRFKVRAAFVTLYAYSHANVERWSYRGLEGFASRTVNDGTETAVDVSRMGNSFKIDTMSDAIAAPAPLVSSTYWHPATRDGGRMVNTETGEVDSFATAFLGHEEVETKLGTLEAEKYRLSGAVDMEIWYAAGRWVRSRFEIGGDQIEYVLTEGARDLVLVGAE